MKENSIEEDIKILENLKTAIDTGCVNFGGKSMYDCGYQEAIEHILSDYKRVLEINEVLLKENINITKEYSVKDLEDIFGEMKVFTKEENDYFWNKIKEKSTIIEGIDVI